MISFRYHIVSIVSVFLALAVGIALGGGPLKGEVDNSLVKELATRKAEVVAKTDQLAVAKEAAQFADSYASTSAADVLRKKLRGKTVAILTLPDADHTAEGAMAALVQNAGGTITGSFAIGSKLGKVANRPLVEELTSQMVTSTNLVVPSGGTGYQRLGALIGRAISSKVDGSAYDSTAQSIMSGLSTAGLVLAEGTPSSRADLVLVLAGPADNTDLGNAANSIVSNVLGALVTYTDGMVLAGPASAAKAGGLLKVSRDDVSLGRSISTVDSTDSGAGQVVTVLALATRARGTIGQWGAVDAANGAMPGAPTP